MIWIDLLDGYRQALGLYGFVELLCQTITELGGGAVDVRFAPRPQDSADHIVTVATSGTGAVTMQIREASP